MYTFAVGFGVLLHVFFWGAGLAWSAMPKPWRQFWPVLALPAGLALQSAVVWLGTYAGWRGTDSYAAWSEVLPLLWIILAARREHGSLGRALARFGGLWLTVLAQLSLVFFPFVRVTRGLTTVSLGSLDAADYAEGARVFKEFAHGDRTGFLGLTEVVRVASVDNVGDFWLRLNHFTPSALVAFNGTIFHCQPHELISVMAAVLLASSLPLVFWTARALLGLRAPVSLAITLLYGLSPVTLYAVYHVALGQLLAAPAIALVTWAGVTLWRGLLSWRRAAAMAGVLVIAYALIFGGYNFIIVVCLVPAVAFAGGRTLVDRRWRRLAAWLAAMLAPLVLAGLLFWERVAGLAERFRLFRVYDFGWHVPLLTPEGWLGFVADHEMHPLGGDTRWLLAGAVALGIAAGWIVLGRRQPQRAWLALSLVLSPLVGYAYLYFRGLQIGTNASYDAYKILAVFFPGILTGALAGLAIGSRRTAAGRWALALGVALTLAGGLWAYRIFSDQLRLPALGVTRELVQLRRLETDPSIGSLNLLTTDGWSRLWANAELLRLPQYFDTHTYEGRLNTPLRGRWDLIGGVLAVELPDGGSRRVGPHHTIVDTRSPFFFRVRFGAGWYELEQPFGLPSQWRWAQASATLRVTNPQPRALPATLTLSVRALTPQTLEVWLDGKRQAAVEVGLAQQTVQVPVFEIPPGESTIEFRSPSPARLSGDARSLATAFYEIGISVR